MKFQAQQAAKSSPYDRITRRRVNDVRNVAENRWGQPATQSGAREEMMNILEATIFEKGKNG